MRTSKFILGATVAVVAFSMGVLVASYLRWGHECSAEVKSAAQSSAEFVHLQKENSALKAEVERWRLASETSAKEVADGSVVQAAWSGKRKWAFLIELSKQKLFYPRFTFMDATGALSPSAVSLFDLTPEEQATMSRASAAARDKIEALEKAHATVRHTGDNKVKIFVDPFPTEGGAVYDELMKTFGKTLGEERYAAFLTLGGEQFDRTLGAFGATEREVEVTSQPDSKSGRYLATDVQRSLGGMSTSSLNYQSRDELVSRVGTIAKLLPTDF